MKEGWPESVLWGEIPYRTIGIFVRAIFFKWGMKTNEMLGEQCEDLLLFFIYLMPVFYQINVSIEQE